MKKIFGVLSFILFANSLFSQEAKLINKDALMKTVTLLSSAEFGGRLAGSEGFDKAAKYMADEFVKLKLKPSGDNGGFFQYFNTEYNNIVGPCKFNLVNGQEITNEYLIGKHFSIRGFSGSGDVKANVVFCGYGISQPENDYDDYQNMDVKGKIVMIFKQMPSWKLKEKDWNSSLRYRSEIAYNHGAVAVLFVSKPNDKNPQKPIGSVMDGEGKQIETLPQLQIDISVANDILAKNNIKLKDLQTKIDSIKMPSSIETKTIANVEVKAKYESAKKTENVIALLEGSDPNLKNEYIVVSAHLDHIGTHANEVMYPGANDDASGSAAVLELARAFCSQKEKPKRSIIFMLYACEETGLLGAKFFAEHPVVQLQNINSQINMDCIAFGDSIQIGNGKSVPELWKMIKDIDGSNDKLSIKDTWNGGGADGSPLHDKGIPMAYFVTKDSYGHLHLPSDTAETLNQNLYQSIVRLAYLSTYKIAQGNYKKETVLK